MQFLLLIATIRKFVVGPRLVATTIQASAYSFFCSKHITTTIPLDWPHGSPPLFQVWLRPWLVIVIPRSNMLGTFSN